MPPPIVQDHQVEDRTIALMKEFKKMKLPLFIGGIDPLKEEAWVLGIEKLFEVFPCTEAQKVLLAAFTLEDEACRWNVSEFENLKQGNKTVVEYETQFTKLACFAPHMVDTDYKKVKKFEGGLRYPILEKIDVLKLPKYVNVLDRALMSETNMANCNHTSGSIRDSAPTCPECGKKHRGVCYRTTGACFKCGKTGHVVKNCPLIEQQNVNRPTASSTSSTPTTKATAKPATTGDNVRQGRVFALIPGDTKNIEAVVSGTLFINGQPTHVLLDSSSTHSFVSKAFASNLNRPLEPLDYMCVSLPSGGSMLCAFIYNAYEILIEDIQLYVNLMPLDMDHFDIIL
ncbi:uncharacterized protein LOC114260944 [Camellia sinensis]|uniref:uncharacterized protein LOC114260944 n=1 Tax=Camellia sinensis TaxID=4442 RepID=UPI0010364D46|nr:uncharacterized protein LOC114260944 [Camellia sinensis]